MNWLNQFKKKSKVKGEVCTLLKADFHSHLIPGIDDGVKTIEQSIEILQLLHQQGVKKVITTPHIISDAYPNTPQIIKSGETAVRKQLQEQQIEIDFYAAAEYYIDEWFEKESRENVKGLLTFEGNHILVETNYMSKPEMLDAALFNLQAENLKIVFAHPERYNYLLADFKQFHELHERGLFFQINLLSLTGHYGPQIKKAVNYLIKHKMVDAVGSDIHKIEHLIKIGALKRTAEYKTLMGFDLLNHQWG